MKVVCQACEKVIDTEGDLKGNTAYQFNLEIDYEPRIASSVRTRKSGYLCYECSTHIGRKMGVIQGRGIE